MERSIEITTIHGKLNIVRTMLYERKSGECVFPKDEYIEIADLPFKMTKAMMCETAYYAQNQASFASASDMILRSMGIEIDKETVRKVSDYVGGKVHAADVQRAAETYENIEKMVYEPNRKGTLYIMTDGATVNTRTKDANGSTWRENKLALIFTDRELLKTKSGSNIILKKEYVSYLGSVDEFKKHVFETAVRNGYGTFEKVIFIGDGATWIRNMCNELFPDAQQILDKYHLCENIYTYAKQLLNNSTEYTRWAETVIDMIEKGFVGKALDMIENDGKDINTTLNLAGYIRNNIDKIDYKYYEEQGWFIGSGAIESGNKIVLQRRLKQSGMRWNKEEAQFMLTLRAKHESNLWKAHVQELIHAS
jgi:hypothetical protein